MNLIELLRLKLSSSKGKEQVVNAKARAARTAQELLKDASLMRKATDGMAYQFWENEVWEKAIEDIGHLINEDDKTKQDFYRGAAKRSLELLSLVHQAREAEEKALGNEAGNTRPTLYGR
jgi:hypothetical protein